MIDADVAVVGAGIAGLRAADLLAARGLRVVVLEARDRVGGRLWSRRIGEATFDLGGQWIGPHQRRATALAAELGLRTFPTFDRGDKILCLGTDRRRYRGTIPRLDPLALLELQLTLDRIERLRRRVSTERPGASPDARALDAITLAAWQDAHVKRASVRALMDAAVRVVFGVEARELSMLTFLFYAQAGEGFMRLIEIEGGAQETRFTEGAQGLALGLAARLGDAVRTGCPVRAIEATRTQVTLRHDGGSVRARCAVLALPPTLLRAISIAPTLPAEVTHRLERSPIGATTKHVLTYARPFWRDDGLSGEVVCDEGPFSVAFDNTAGPQAALLCFAVGQEARDASLRDPHGRRRRVVARLVECFGPEAARPTEHVEVEWAREPWTRGCPVGLAAPGTLSALTTPLGVPQGTLHFAGTETAREHHGFIEGALESAERVAAEIR